MERRLILFDIDGTLIDTAGAGRRAMERAFREVLLVSEALSAPGVAFAGRTDPVILDSLAEALGVDGGTLAARRHALVEAFVAALEDEMRRPDPRRRVLSGVRGLLERLATRDGVSLGLLTGNLEAGARVKLAAFDLNRFFPAGGFSSDDPDRREIARIAHRRLSALARFEFRPDQVTVVGDTHHDIDCAQANGFRAVAVDSGWVPRETLERARPDVLLDDLADPQVMAALGLDEAAAS